MPAAGGIVSSAFDLLIGNPTLKRIETFADGLAEQLQDLETRGLLTVDSLISEGEASALFLHALQAAMRADGEKKIEALKIVAAKGASYRPDERHISFITLQLLDRITDPHIHMLKIISAPPYGGCLYYSAAVMLGVELFESNSGLAEPQRTVDGTFFDRRSCTINEIVLKDLCALGLLEVGLEIPDYVSEWSEDPAQNGRDTINLTTTGRLMLKEMSHREPGATNL